MNSPSFLIPQQPRYADPQLAREIEDRLRRSPALVFPLELDLLRARLAEVARGERFLLQGGDCAESFREFSEEKVRSTVRVLGQMTEILESGIGRPVVTIGRIAGQFAKPRSQPLEMHGTETLETYRGDLINGHDFTPDARRPDPLRLERAYGQSAGTINVLRAMCALGEAPKHFFTSHEALLLAYEEALVRPTTADAAGRSQFVGSGHFLWIGDRTRQPDGAHVAFLSRVRNPLGLKCGPSLGEDELMQLIERLDPMNEAGRLTLILRIGAENAEKRMPTLLRRVRREGRHVAIICDPMHGNTTSTADGYKTRDYSNIVRELRTFCDVSHAEGTIIGGVHLELSGHDVTECVGGPQGLRAEDLRVRYETLCDPRLNATQALALAHAFRSLLPSA